MPDQLTAVVTTGIYCRTGCSGRPLERNTLQFGFAAAAESAGFRPCLKCRPDDRPGPGSWVGPSELVCRGLRLITDGALDGGTEDELASRLGVSQRHLRRLFETHVGATPDAVARSRRAHFARRLLDETNLPVAVVGFAAGFGSVRQMNRTMRQIFRFSPTELRARRRRPGRLVADGGLALRLTYRDPFDWNSAAGYLAARATPGVESVSGGIWRRLVVHDGSPALLEVRGADGHVALTAHLPTYDGLIHLASGVRRVFGLDEDVSEAASALAKDPFVGPLARRAPGLRVPQGWDSFELGVRAIAGQQISVAAATTVTGRIAANLGTPVPGLEPLGLSRLFPTADVVAGARLSDLGMPEARGRAVVAFSEAVAAGRVVLDGSSGLDELLDALQRLPGVGPWTAGYIAMRACGERDAFPSGDLGLRRALAVNGKLPSAAELLARAEAWRPWRAWAAMHLWTASGTESRGA